MHPDEAPLEPRHAVTLARLQAAGIPHRLMADSGMLVLIRDEHGNGDTETLGQGLVIEKNEDGTYSARFVEPAPPDNVEPDDDAGEEASAGGDEEADDADDEDDDLDDVGAEPSLAFPLSLCRRLCDLHVMPTMDRRDMAKLFREAVKCFDDGMAAAAKEDAESSGSEIGTAEA